METNTPPEGSAPDLTGKAKSLANLKPVQPGEVRNPNGKKRGTLNTSTIIKKWLSAKEELPDKDKDQLPEFLRKKGLKLSQLDLMTLAMIKKGREGDVQAFNALLDRLDGKPTQKTILANDDENPLPPPTKQVIVLPGGQEIEF